jgi:hypothetical protein
MGTPLDDLHDEPLADDHAARRPAEVVVSAQDRARILGGQAARRVPWVASGGTVLTGVGAWRLVEATAGVDPALSGGIALGTCAVTAASVVALRVRFRDRRDPESGYVVERIPRAYRGRWWGAAWLHALWVDAMALGATNAVGPWGMAAILGGGTALLSLRWMRDHPVELPMDTPPQPVIEPPTESLAVIEPPEPVKFPAPPEPDDGDLIAEKWAARVAGGDSPIVPGSSLGDDREDLPYGYRWIVQLDAVNGTIGCTQLRDMADAIALRLEIRPTHVDFARLEGADDREDRAILTVVTRDALAEGIEYLGPEYLDGEIPLGQYAAGGTERPHWIARDDTGPQPGMVTGGQGSGKSKLLTKLGIALRASQEWLVVFGDGDEHGRSAPLLKRIAYDFAKGATEVREQLLAIEAWMQQRGIDLGALTEDERGRPIPMTDPGRQEQADKVLPCRAFPGLVWILDEFHRLAKGLGRWFVERVAKLVRFGRKLGLTVVVGTQSALVEDFGGLDEFRGMLAQGNCVIMRTKNRAEANVVADFGVDPSTLPKGGGYFVIDDDEGRKALARTEHPEGMGRWVRGLAPYVPDELPARVYASKRPPKPADPRADYEETQRRRAATLAALEAGELLPWELEAQQRAEQSGAQPVAPVGGDGVALPGQAPVDDDPSRWTMGGVGVPDVSLPALPDPHSAATPGDVPLHWKSEKLLAALRSEPARAWTSAELGRAAGLSSSDVSTFGRPLLERGLTHRPTGKTGYWQAGPAPVAVAN